MVVNVLESAHNSLQELNVKFLRTFQTGYPYFGSLKSAVAGCLHGGMGTCHKSGLLPPPKPINC